MSEAEAGAAPGPLPAGAAPRFSLVVSTLGRDRELRKLLESLALQEQADFELILVDQNPQAERVAGAIAGGWPFPILHLHRPDMRGLSRGRNEGLRLARGAYLVFPDDDCWYPADFLARAEAILAGGGYDFCSGRAADEAGRSINGRFETEATEVDRANVWTTAIEWMQVFRTDMLAAIQGYDEDIGAGASTPWQSSEGPDITLRALAAGYRGCYDPALIGHHAELEIAEPDRRMIGKMRVYGRGMGYVLRKHGYGPLAMAGWLMRSAGGALVAALKGRPARARLYLNVFLGRLEGYLRREPAP